MKRNFFRCNIRFVWFLCSFVVRNSIQSNLIAKSWFIKYIFRKILPKYFQSVLFELTSIWNENRLSFSCIPLLFQHQRITQHAVALWSIIIIFSTQFAKWRFIVDRFHWMRFIKCNSNDLFKTMKRNEYC